MSTPAGNAFKLTLDARTDGISSLHFSPDSSSLLISSWDKGVTLYNVRQNKQIRRYTHAGAVLSATFNDTGTSTYSGGLDKVIRTCQIEVGTDRVIGQHDGPIRCVEWSQAINALVTGSWDQTARVFDTRQQQAEVAVAQLSERVYAMDVCETTLLLGLADGSIQAFDVRAIDSGPLISRPCSLGHQIRCLKVFERGGACLIGSIEGRVAVENLDINLPIAKRYAFRCHRTEEHVYPVNAIAVRPSVQGRVGIFATGGADGTIVVWDSIIKKRICQFPSLETSCSALDFSPDGLSLAVASSYTYEQGDLPHPPDSVLIFDSSDEW